MSDDKLFTDIQSAIAEVLDCEESEVTKESKLFADLGAESIDMLDIASELEKLVNKEVDLTKMEGYGEGDADMTVTRLLNFVTKLRDE